MKKLMSIAAAALCGAAFADTGITSANVVGYQAKDMTDKQYNSVGATFLSVNGTGKFKLGDIQVEGFSYDVDILQVLSTSTASTIAKYTYVTPEMDVEDFLGDGAAVGWWVRGKEGNEEFRADDLEFDAGQGFLGNFAHKKVKLTFSGQVISGKTTLDLRGKQYNLIANFLPKDITLGSVEVEGFSYDVDILQVLSETTASTIEKYTYVTPEMDTEDFMGDGAAVGWWVRGKEGKEEFRADDKAWKAGDALLGNFAHKQVQLTFPAAY